ncbi:MAG: hypothetical protein AVDCRST_MAG69-1342, partial [uncultured Solirubrobacteraceae bacterium]
GVLARRAPRGGTPALHRVRQRRAAAGGGRLRGLRGRAGVLRHPAEGGEALPLEMVPRRLGDRLLRQERPGRRRLACRRPAADRACARHRAGAGPGSRPDRL